MVIENKTCDYKFMTSNKSGTYDRFKKKYKTLVGKDAPPIDSWEFKRDQPATIVYPRYRTMPEQKWVNGKHTKYTYHETSPIVGIFIVVRPYSSGRTHSAHAISAVKYNDTLFAFNAWGRNHLAKDINIFRKLKIKYNCSKLFIYKGPSMQAGDPYGVCVGYATNFVMEMLVKIEEGTLPIRVTQEKYNFFVHTALSQRGICFGSKCVKDDSMSSKWSKMEMNLQKTLPTPSPQSLNTLKLTNLKKLASKYKVQGVSTLEKGQLLNKLKSEFKQLSRENIGTIKFEEATPTPKPAPKPKPAPTGKTLAELRAYARNRCLKGRSKYTRKINLQRFIQNTNKTPLPMLNRNSISQLKAQELRNYASSRCVSGYGKYTKKTNLLKYILNKI